MINMLASVIITLAMIAVPFLITYIFNHYSDEHDQKPVDAFGDKGLLMLVSCCILLWFVPWGVILLLPIALSVSAVSPAGRQSWQRFSKIRSTSIACMMIVLLIGGFLPVSDPISPDAWGEPMFTENPNAPNYPSGQQYTWLMRPSEGGLNVEIVQSLKLRTPHQFAKFGASSSTLTIADVFDMQESRLAQAIQLLDQQIVFDIDEDAMKLVPIQVKNTHNYNPTGEQHELNIRLYELRSLTLSSDIDGVKVGEVFCAAKSSWGGELDILVVVRPVGHTGLVDDRYAEGLTVQWILAD